MRLKCCRLNYFSVFISPCLGATVHLETFDCPFGTKRGIIVNIWTVGVETVIQEAEPGDSGQNRLILRSIIYMSLAARDSIPLLIESGRDTLISIHSIRIMHENLNHPWLSLRELSSLVESVILRREPGKRPELETALRKYKPNFITLLKNIPPSTEDAELVKKASEKNSELPGCSQYSLSPRICEEALIVSELFQLNEISSLQLLVAGEEQLSQYPGLTRGLVSVLLYYDSRKALVQSLRSLIQSREGLSWTLETPQDITQLSTAYTTSLLEEGLVDKILTLLKDLDWQVRDLFQEVRQGLADCIYCYAAQSGLPKNETLRLLDYLSKVKPTEGTASGVLDSVNLTLTMAALYAIDISSINKCEDGEERNGWEHLVIQSLLQFGWSMLLCSMRSLPQHPTAPNYVDEDDNPNMFKEEFYMRRLHQLLTDLIVLMPLKVKELRNRADDAGRNKLMHDQEGISYAVPLAGQHFEHLLNTISSLYKDDSLALGLMLEYWCPSEGGGKTTCFVRFLLTNFVRLAGDLLVPSLFMPYLDMLLVVKVKCLGIIFFNSLQQQYFFNLRQGMPQTPLASSAIDTSTIYMHRPMTRGISPQEIKGLSSVLRLIAAVCNYSEVARVAIGDNSVWQPILVLVGLLGCAVPTNLKSDVLLTLSVLAKSPEFSSLIWQSIESAQLEIGSLALILISISFGDHVFLKCHTRSYKIPGEKWQVASLCLKLIFKLLKEYEPLPGLFEKEVHPGFKIVVHLLQTSELLRMLTFILDEGCSILETYTDFPGKEHLEESCLYFFGNFACRISGARICLRGSTFCSTRIVGNVYILSDTIANSIMKGFTDVLDDELDYETDNAEVIGSAKIAIVKLLQSGLDMPAPSFSHFLLGFDLKKRCFQNKSSTASLASNHVTSEPTLRYLRSSEDFLSTQLSLLPLKIDESKEPAVHALKAVSWLLKTVAVELKIVSASRLRSQISHLTDLLLDSSSVGSKMVDGQGDDSQFLGGILTDASLTQLSRAPTTMNPSIHTESHGQHRLLALLNFIDFNENPIDPPSWQLFDDAQVNQVLKDCETLSSNGERSIKVQELHRILNAELTNLQVSSSLNQRQLINDEIQNILLYAVRWNAVQEEALTRRHLLDAWRQVTEVLLCSIPLDILPSSSKQQLLLELLQTLLNKVLQDGTMSELSNKVSGVLLLLLAALRQTYIATESIDGPMLMGESYVPILDAQTSVLNNPGKKNSINRVYSTALQVILKGLIQWIEGTSASSQRGEKSSSVSDINSLELSDQGKLRKANLEVLAGFGENFLEIICRDSVRSWIWYLSNQGYLRHLIESIKSEDEGLLQLMTSNSRAEGNLRTLYTYESKIGMLTRLASTMSGAELLLESGLMLRLAEIQVFSARPEPPIEIGAPSALDRYHQILFPVLRLCQTIMSSLGGIQNRSATVQILHFISANEDLKNLAALQELGLLTGVISRCAASDDIHDVDSLGSLSRLQRLMLSLIPQFNLKIHANVINFARNIVTLSANNSKYCRILFTPSLSEAHGSDGHEYLNISIPSRPPSLGPHCYYLQDKVILDPAFIIRRVSYLIRIKRVDWEINGQTSFGQELLFSFGGILEHFLLYACKNQDTPYQKAVKRLNDEPFMAGDSSCVVSPAYVSSDGIAKLKEEAVTVFSDSLFMKLQDVEQLYSKKQSSVFEKVIGKFFFSSLIPCVKSASSRSKSIKADK
ncbi:NUP205 [Lepeophtheirus salmonis]|uniref:NUP205 n=1 Tax=Lepeophtheirus salmonis TaxID=72036 RepID=A0A7R8CM30_LEPSM|nr:NUP205 [Lepeophtheirus salmonis]CAF2861479.1 NUP205 [Lepeophtheirus salmonis]